MSEPLVKRLCIFDWNGTLQDDLHHIYECGVRRIFAHFGLPCPTLDEYRNEVSANFMPFYHAHGIPTDVGRDDLNAIMAEGFKEKGRPADLFPDAADVVRMLHEWGFELMVVSGYAQEKLDAAVSRSGLGPFFSRVIGDVSAKEPVYEECVRISGAGHVVGVGDTVEDALAARSVGGTAFLCHRGFHTKERLSAETADLEEVYLIDALSDVIGLLS